MKLTKSAYYTQKLSPWEYIHDWGLSSTITKFRNNKIVDIKKRPGIISFTTVLRAFLLFMFSIVPGMANSPLDARLYDKMKIFLLFIGYNRSRHTLLASLLDAHPNVIIANDFNILKDWIVNPLLSQRSKNYIYELLLAKSRYDVMFGVRSRSVRNNTVKYRYNVKDQWQGRYNNSILVSRADTKFIKCLASTCINVTLSNRPAELIVKVHVC